MARSSRLESGFQDRLVSELKARYPGCITMKVDAFQGVPDLLVLSGNKWALLEVKRSHNAEHQPNQDYYVDLFNSMGFSSFIHPQNEEEILRRLDEYFYS